MKVLYAIQTTGNGHLSRAKALLPYLQRRFNVDILLSGPKDGIQLEHSIKYHLKGLTLYHTEKGSISWRKTLFKNNFLRFIIDLIKTPVHQYDLVINDYEPITAWGCKLYGVLCFGLSNQFSLWHEKLPEHQPDWNRKLGYIRYFAPVKHGYGLHYESFADRIYTPILRPEIYQLQPSSGGGILVYLPALPVEGILKVLKGIPHVDFKIFSNRVKKTHCGKNYTVCPIDEKEFITALASADGVITNAGFTTTAECIYLKKPLMVVPMQGQVEQLYNAYTLKKMGVEVVKRFDSSQRKKIKSWIKKPNHKYIPFNNDLNQLVDRIALDYIKIKYSTASLTS